MFEGNIICWVQGRLSTDISIAAETCINEWEWDCMHDMKV